MSESVLVQSRFCFQRHLIVYKTGAEASTRDDLDFLCHGRRMGCVPEGEGEGREDWEGVKGQGALRGAVHHEEEPAFPRLLLAPW